MTVAELIERLQELKTPDVEIGVYHYGIITAVDAADQYNQVIIRTDSEDE